MPDLPFPARALVAAILMCTAAASSAQSSQYEMPPVPVEVATVRVESLVPSVSLPGTVLSRDDSRVASPLAGVVLEVAEVGTRVSAGDVLAQINTAALEISRRESMAQVEREQRRIEFLAAEVTRFDSLGTGNLAARSQIEQARLDLAVARSELAIAQARLAQIDFDLRRSTIRAPFDGTITQRFVNPFEGVLSGGLVARLVGDSRLEVSALAPIRSVRFIAPGDTLQVKGAYQTLDATVRSKIPSSERGAHMFELRVPVPPGTFAVNEDVRLGVPTDAAEVAIVIPRDALVLRRGQTLVYRINGDDVAEAVSVKPGAGRGSDITVAGELAAGDRVVTRGAERLSDGARVRTTVVERRELSGS